MDTLILNLYRIQVFPKAFHPYLKQNVEKLEFPQDRVKFSDAAAFCANCAALCRATIWKNLSNWINMIC